MIALACAKAIAARYVDGAMFVPFAQYASFSCNAGPVKPVMVQTGGICETDWTTGRQLNAVRLPATTTSPTMTQRIRCFTVQFPRFTLFDFSKPLPTCGKPS